MARVGVLTLWSRHESIIASQSRLINKIFRRWTVSYTKHDIQEIFHLKSVTKSLEITVCWQTPPCYYVNYKCHEYRLESGGSQIFPNYDGYGFYMTDKTGRYYIILPIIHTNVVTANQIIETYLNIFID